MLAVLTVVPTTVNVTDLAAIFVCITSVYSCICYFLLRLLQVFPLFLLVLLLFIGVYGTGDAAFVVGCATVVGVASLGVTANSVA